MTEAVDPPLVCANHPGRETGLRCNRCEKPICAQCAVRTPTGYRCQECVRDQQKAFDTAEWFDYPIAILVGGGLAYIGSLIVPSLGFFSLFLAPGAGLLIATIVQSLLRRRRGRRLFRLTTIAVAVGSLLNLGFFLFVILTGVAQGSFGGLFGLLWQGYYAFAVTSAVYYRLSGIRFGR